eukprot:7859795-Pyramimonas_sp.AAC.1
MEQSSGSAEHCAIMLATTYSADQCQMGVLYVDYATLLKAVRAHQWALSGANPMAHIWREVARRLPGDPPRLPKVKAHRADEDVAADQ